MESTSAPSKVILYNYWRSSASWRVRIALAWKGIDYEYVCVHLLKDEQNSEEHKRLNPMGRVPALVIDGHTLAESVAILEYLEETRKERPLLPADPVKRATVRQLVEIVNSAIQPMQNIAVLDKISGEFKQDRKAWAQLWIRKGMAAFEQIVSTSAGKYSVGDEVTFADACIIPQVYACSRFEISLDEYPTIKRVVENLGELEEFKKAHANSQPDAEQV
ncbi:hypothetical protein FGO68_gene17391 [Halteria grandinella]|uniref:Maleylacetoacetate isomerase n=1 Tax=Halteria grandinella TaxID=5974 RepID=A0A8J8NHV9_HALGN|nr:hypothetical protein FGO68_gene17391 [Halteria grandinella]